MDELEQKSYNVMVSDLKRLMAQAQEDKKRISELWYENERLRKEKTVAIDDETLNEIVNRVLNRLNYGCIADNIVDCIGTLKFKCKRHKH